MDYQLTEGVQRRRRTTTKGGSGFRIGGKEDGVSKYCGVMWRNKSNDLDMEAAEENGTCAGPEVTFVSPAASKHTQALQGSVCHRQQ